MAKKKDKKKQQVRQTQKAKGVNWDLVWKVLASVFAFAGSVATVYDLVGKVRSDGRTFFTFILPGLAVIVWFIVLVQLIRKKNLYVIPLLAVTVIGGIVGGVGWQSYNKMQEDKVIVLIAKFDGPEETYGLQRQIIEDLREATESYSDTLIIEADELVTSSEYAHELGKKVKADLVIWAWYRPTENPNITIHIENLSPTQISMLQESEVYQPKATLAQLESFEIQRQLGSETSTLISFLTGMLSYKSGDYQTAVVRFEQVLGEYDLSTYVDSSTLYFYIGYSYGELEEVEQSIQNYSKSIELNPNNSMAYNNRGLIYDQLGEYVLALQDLNKVIEITPQSAVAYVNRGAIYYSLEDYARAIQDLDQAIKINPQLGDSHYNLGLVYKNSGDYERAIRAFDKAAELNPQDMDVYNSRGMVYDLIGDYSRAIEDFDKAIELNPQFVDAYYNRGLEYYYLKDYKHAIKDYDKVIELDPEYKFAYNNRGNAYYSLGDHKRAIQDFEKAIELDPQYAKAYNNRGTAYVNLGQYDRAIQDYDKAIEIDPQLTDAYKNRGQAFELIGKIAEAEADYKKFEELTGQEP
jgi:tetratricopeptide (TPR) repeat protein